MNTDSLYRTLIRAGRADPPPDMVPYAFEKRVMTAIRGLSQPDPLKGWVLGLWRAALSCAGVAAVACLIAARVPAVEEEFAVNTAPMVEADDISGALVEGLDSAELW